MLPRCGSLSGPPQKELRGVGISIELRLFERYSVNLKSASNPTQFTITIPSNRSNSRLRGFYINTVKMVAMYSVLGRQVGSHHLAMGVLGAMFGGAYFGLSGGSKKPANQAPPINASTPDEADFIQNFLKQADEDEKKNKH
ncbi:hypothetical protein F5Y16DRAFT_393413 [Xylariaceae sp. FL0255]|nr:hypothetical protein F5Y16DRAFT_393413 [Xylariaceae sp. FL0255]